MDETSPPDSGTRRDFANMLNPYIHKKKKDPKNKGFSPWTKMGPKKGY